jgi:hypothetical protein
MQVTIRCFNFVLPGLPGSCQGPVHCRRRRPAKPQAAPEPQVSVFGRARNHEAGPLQQRAGRAAELRVDDAEPQVPERRAEQDRVTAKGVHRRRHAEEEESHRIEARAMKHTACYKIISLRTFCFPFKLSSQSPAFCARLPGGQLFLLLLFHQRRPLQLSLARGDPIAGQPTLLSPSGHLYTRVTHIARRVKQQATGSPNQNI